jgi:hypothetical protein
VSLVEFEPSEVERLLDLLHQRLRRRRLRASIYVVGGAAIAITVPGASDRPRRFLRQVVSTGPTDGQYWLATKRSWAGKRVITCGPSSVSTISSSIRAAE